MQTSREEIRQYVQERHFRRHRAGLYPGKVDIFIQNAAPVEHESNWLPAPAGKFILWSRVYIPGAAILDGKCSVQFTDPSKNTNFAYVGKRATGTQVGDYLITGPGWNGTVPQGVKQISSPNNAVLLLGRVLVKNDGDLATAYDLS